MSMTLQNVSEALSTLVETVGRSVVRVEGGGRPASGIVFGPRAVVTLFRGERTAVEVVVEGRSIKGTVKGVDEATGLALVTLEEELPVVELDDGGGAKVGQLVLRLGRPGETVRATSGIISALGRRPVRLGATEFDRWLETDAPVRPGFAGGPVVSVAGAVLGLTAAGPGRGAGVVTIPTPTVRRVVASLEAHGRVRRSHLGVSLQPTSLPEAVRALTGDEVGLIVTAVEPGGPAERAGVAFGDTVLHLGDDSVRTLDDLMDWLRVDRGGVTTKIRLFRAGQVLELPVVLGAR